MSIRDDIASIILMEGLKGADDRSLKAACADTADAILARYGIVELPRLNEADDDGQIELAATWLRIDTSGLRGAEVIDDENGAQLSPGQLRRRAADYLAAANYVEGNPS